MEDELVKKIIFELLANAKDAAEESRKDHNDLFNSGRALAYYEVIDIIKARLEIYGYDVSRYGLDMDIENLL